MLDIDELSVRRGERLFIAGPSGSGKSTLLSLLGGVVVPRTGSVEVLDTNLAAMRGWQRDRFRADHVGFVFQMFNLVPYLSVVDNVTLPCRFSDRRRQRAESRSTTVDGEARRLLAALELDHDGLLERSVVELSIGQQQRVAAARALIGEPEIVIADEPTSALDEGTRERFLELLFAECERAHTTLLFVSHDLPPREPFQAAHRSRRQSTVRPRGRRREGATMAIVRLAASSVWNRRSTAGLTVLAVAISVAMLLGVEKLRNDARAAFTNTISGTELIVGARSGAVQLLLYSVFRIGNATNNISWESYQDIARHPRVAWTVPISLGDSHRGYRVMGTSREYFERYRYAGGQIASLRIRRRRSTISSTRCWAPRSRRSWATPWEIPSSSLTAPARWVSRITTTSPSESRASSHRTGTPADRTVHVSLEGIEAMHVDWRSGIQVPSLKVTAEEVRKMDLAAQGHHRLPGRTQLEGVDIQGAAFRERLSGGGPCSRSFRASRSRSCGT